jgi:hypothetical protein
MIHVMLKDQLAMPQQLVKAKYITFSEEAENIIAAKARHAGSKRTIKQFPGAGRGRPSMTAMTAANAARRFHPDGEPFAFLGTAAPSDCPQRTLSHRPLPLRKDAPSAWPKLGAVSFLKSAPRAERPVLSGHSGLGKRVIVNLHIAASTRASIKTSREITDLNKMRIDEQKRPSAAATT